MLAVELLEGVVRQHRRPGPLGDAQDEGVTPADGARRRRHDLAGELRLLELLALGRVDPVLERGVDDHHDLGVGVLGGVGPDRLVQLGQARQGPALGGQVGPVHDDVVPLRHPAVPSPASRTTIPAMSPVPAQPTARSRRSACSSWWSARSRSPGWPTRSGSHGAGRSGREQRCSRAWTKDHAPMFSGSSWSHTTSSARVAVEHRLERLVRPGIELLDPHDRHRLGSWRSAPGPHGGRHRAGQPASRRAMASWAILPLHSTTRRTAVAAGDRRVVEHLGERSGGSSRAPSRVAWARSSDLGVITTSGTGAPSTWARSRWKYWAAVVGARPGGCRGRTASGTARCGPRSARGPGPRSRGGATGRARRAGPTCPRRPR